MDYREVEMRVKSGEIHARFVFEIAGFPKEHVDKSLEVLVKRFEDLDKQKKMAIVESKINPSAKMDESISAKMFTGFIEIEFLFKKISDLIGLVYDFMPSSIEIIAPSAIKEDAGNLSDIINDLAAKMHLFDITIKKMKAANIMLAKEIEQIKGSPAEYFQAGSAKKESDSSDAEKSE